jgi:hypothetical protein
MTSARLSQTGPSSKVSFRHLETGGINAMPAETVHRSSKQAHEIHNVKIGLFKLLSAATDCDYMFNQSGVNRLCPGQPIEIVIIRMHSISSSYD